MQSTRNSGRLLGKEQKNYSTMDTTDPEKQEEVSASETASERLENSAVPEASSKSNDVTSPSQQNKVNHQLDIEVSNISSKMISMVFVLDALKLLFQVPDRISHPETHCMSQCYQILKLI